MGYAGEASVLANVNAIRGDTAQLGPDLFIFFFKKFPNKQESFPNYKGQSLESLPSNGRFPTHTKNVLDAVLDLVEIAGDDGKLTTAAKGVIADHVTRKTKMQDYKDLFAVMVPFLESKMDVSADAKSGWGNVAGRILGALQAAS